MKLNGRRERRLVIGFFQKRGAVDEKQKYFDDVSNQWDSIPRIFFSDSIKEKLCEEAQVKEGLLAVDISRYWLCNSRIT